MQLNSLIKELVSGTPPNEVDEVKAGLSFLVPASGMLVVNESIAEYLESEGHANGSVICSTSLKDPKTGKFVDFIKDQKFYYDFVKAEATDFEKLDPEKEVPPYFEELVELLNAYGKSHFPSSFHFSVTPVRNKIYVLILSERKEPANFYSGRWKSAYTIEGQSIHADVETDIHYYEEGNVRLHSSNSFDETLPNESAKTISDFIKTTEDCSTLQTVKQFDELNQNHFKHLRRLLPVTKSKINWGKAIGNYKLGSSVVSR